MSHSHHSSHRRSTGRASFITASSQVIPELVKLEQRLEIELILLKPSPCLSAASPQDRCAAPSLQKTWFMASFTAHCQQAKDFHWLHSVLWLAPGTQNTLQKASSLLNLSRVSCVLRASRASLVVASGEFGPVCHFQCGCRKLTSPSVHLVLLLQLGKWAVTKNVAF